jgi:hypothetical protein
MSVINHENPSDPGDKDVEENDEENNGGWPASENPEISETEDEELKKPESKWEKIGVKS